MKFDFAIGNPPYQEESIDNGRQPPIYNFFMDEAYKVANCVELITPARFLFNAGQTPKAWNEKMLNDENLKVLLYEQDATKIFSNTDIKGGVAITIHNIKKKFGKIEIFTEFPELTSILDKVRNKISKDISTICIGAVPYKYTEKLKIDHPEWVEYAGESYDLRTNALDKLAEKLFIQTKQNEDDIGIYGLYKKKRTVMYANKSYIDGPKNFNSWKLLISKANGAGKFGEQLSQMIVAAPGYGHTQSFISIGNFDSELQVKNLEKYIKTKFSRCLLSILRTTQDTTPYKWKYVPLQDFSSNSDIDWTQTVSAIDQQLYKNSYTSC